LAILLLVLFRETLPLRLGFRLCRHLISANIYIANKVFSKAAQVLAGTTHAPAEAGKNTNIVVAKANKEIRNKNNIILVDDFAHRKTALVRRFTVYVVYQAVAARYFFRIGKS
jgi:negative regulator of replication initiation